MRRKAHMIGIAGVALVLLVIGSGCSRADRAARVEGRGGGGGQEFTQPHVLTSGTYQGKITVPGDSSAEDAGNAAAAAEDAKPSFMGWLNGIYVFPAPRDRSPEAVPDPAAQPIPPCQGSARVVSGRELEESPHFIKTPSYLPPGTVEAEGAYGEACGSDIVLVSRQFQLRPYGESIGIVLRLGTKTAHVSASRERIVAGSLRGRPAIFIRPVTEEGFGSSHIFILEPYGLTQVGVTDLPFSELQKIAEGLR